MNSSSRNAGTTGAATPDGAANAPDGYSFIPIYELGADPYDAISRRLRVWQSEMAFFRVTDLTLQHAKPPYPEGVYIEAWRVRPDQQPPFDFPLTSAEGVRAQVDQGFRDEPSISGKDGADD
jgi:hypothetical protein